MFQPHKNLSDEINSAIIQSEIEGGVYFRDLPEPAMLEVETQNRYYSLVIRHDGTAWIWGHPEYCPEPVLVKVNGCNWGGSMIKSHFLGRGMHMEFRHPDYPGCIVTSKIVDIKLRSEDGFAASSSSYAEYEA
jgi:alpha-tubulin suppressor-like RCC1 family protein